MTLAETIDTDTVSLTPTAVAAVKDLIARKNLEGYALRIFVSGGGCSGFQYGMAFEGNIREEDHQWEYSGVKVVVDEISIDYLRGATVDYVDNVMGAGFKIENPNALSSCGCGNSFRTKNEGSEGGSCGGGCH